MIAYKVILPYELVYVSLGIDEIRHPYATYKGYVGSYVHLQLTVL